MFIRTKDRILEVTKDTKGTKFIVFGKTLLDYETFIKSEDDIIKQSDTIEELCDEFVLFDKPFNTYGVFDKKVINYKWLKEHRTIYPSKLCIIYGAIWTDKGLIYVAKMNDKGELELI